MAAAWRLDGDYFETCNCDFLCPCLPSNLAAAPSKGYCYFALVFHVDKGHHQALSLDGLNFAVLGHTPGPMGAGHRRVGVVVDERGDPAQRDALSAIASGRAGGPMAAIAPLLDEFLGVETKAIRLPSGDQRGSTFTARLDVSGRVFRLFVSNSHSSIASSRYEAKAMKRPSGDQSG